MPRRFDPNALTFFKNDEAFRLKRRGVLKKRLGPFDKSTTFPNFVPTIKASNHENTESHISKHAIRTWFIVLSRTYRKGKGSLDSYHLRKGDTSRPVLAPSSENPKTDIGSICTRKDGTCYREPSTGGRISEYGKKTYTLKLNANIKVVEENELYSFLKATFEDDFDEEVEDQMFNKKDGFDPTNNGVEDAFDPMLKDCLRYFIKAKKASASSLQGYFGIGYPKANKIVLQMERAGFAVEAFIEMADSDAIPLSASIFARKKKMKNVKRVEEVKNKYL